MYLASQVVEIMATALDSLVQGEIMQLKMDPEKMLDISQYLKKSYYKTASLITNACKSCALLGGHEFGSDVSLPALIGGSMETERRGGRGERERFPRRRLSVGWVQWLVDF